MRRFPPSTIHRYLDLPSTHIIQTHISHRHNATSPLQTLVQAPTHSPPTPPTLPQPKHRHTSNTPHVLTGLVKPKSNPLIHSLTHPSLHPRRSEPNTYTSHTLHQLLFPRNTLIPSMSALLHTLPEPRVPPTCPALTTTTSIPHISISVTLAPSLSLTCNTNGITRIIETTASTCGTTAASQTDQRRPHDYKQTTRTQQ